MKVTIVSATDVKVKSMNPRFSYNFKKDVPKTIPEKHAEKLLRSSNFDEIEPAEDPAKELNTTKNKK